METIFKIDGINLQVEYYSLMFIITLEKSLQYNIKNYLYTIKSAQIWNFLVGRLTSKLNSEYPNSLEIWSIMQGKIRKKKSKNSPWFIFS